MDKDQIPGLAAGVGPAKVTQIFREHEPAGSTDLAAILGHAFASYFERKSSRRVKKTGETIVVITDGEPDDPKAVMQAIIDASRRMDCDDELALVMLQVGTDERATRFLKALDDDLVRVGARFDICDTITMLEMGRHAPRGRAPQRDPGLGTRTMPRARPACATRDRARAALQLR